MSSTKLGEETSFSQNQRTDLSLEERLAPKIDQGEYLLVLVLAVMLWIAGFVDLFTHTSQERDVLGLYSWPYFMFLLVYSLGFVFFALLIFPADSLTWFKKGIHFLQVRPLPFAAWFASTIVLIASMFTWERWTGFPLLQTSLALIIVLFTAVILFMNPFPGERPTPFRKGAVMAFWSVVAIEILMQGLTLARIQPFQNYHGMFTAYGRIYQNREGYANAQMNKFGWYYPDSQLRPGSRRIVILGDSFVQGLQVAKEELFSVLLEKNLNQTANNPPVDVTAFGLPGFGPGLYLNTPLYPYIIEPVQPDEIIVFFHLANDFQTVTGPGQGALYFYVNSSGQVDVTEQDLYLRHDLQHLVIRGYEPINPVETFASHIFVLQPLISFAQRLDGRPVLDTLPQLNTELADSSQPFGAASFVFMDQSNPLAQDAWAVAEGLLETFFQDISDKGVTMRLVTIPYFPEEFYAAQPNQGWTAEVGMYDALLPEKRLKAFALARGIPFLGMGEYLQSAGYTREQIRQLYLQNGTGHFSPAGHAFVAEVIIDCFYLVDENCPAGMP